MVCSYSLDRCEVSSISSGACDRSWRCGCADAKPHLANGVDGACGDAIHWIKTESVFSTESNWIAFGSSRFSSVRVTQRAYYHWNMHVYALAWTEMKQDASQVGGKWCALQDLNLRDALSSVVCSPSSGFSINVLSFIFKGYLATQLNGARMNRDERKVVRVCSET